VHRGAPQTFDISADLTELANTAVLTVCSGAKAILDLPLTLEYLETQGVPVIGYQTDELPAFYSRESGLTLAHRADTPGDVAAICHAQWQVAWEAACWLACPIPEDAALPAAKVRGAIDRALRDAVERGIHGAATTPFLLARVAELTGGESIEANRALLLNNARHAATFAAALGRIEAQELLP